MRKYAPAKGPIQRKRLLRELGRETPRNFGDSPSEVRRAVSAMMGFPPLVKLSQPERAALKAFLTVQLRKNTVKLLDAAKRRSGGETQIEFPRFSNNWHRASREEVRGIFTHAGAYNGTNTFTPNSAGGGPMGSVSKYGSRGLSGLMDDGGLDVRKLVTTHPDFGKRALRVLDVGSAQGEALSDLKREYGDRVETHGLSPESEPHLASDYYHLAAAEHMPAEFARKFDVIWSHRALEYSLLPHAAVSNIAMALAPGGVAQLQFYGYRPFTPAVDHAAKKSLSHYGTGKLDAAGKALVRLGYADLMKQMREHNLGTLDLEAGLRDIDGTAAKVVKKVGGDAMALVAWCNSVGKLARDRRFEVTPTVFLNADGIIYPGWVEIRRKA